MRRGLLLLLLPLGALAQRLDDARALQQKGALREAEQAYQALIAKYRDTDKSSLAGALAGLGQVAWSKGDYDEALARDQEAARLYHELGDAQGESHALNSRGAAGIFKGDYQGALADLRVALAIERAGGDGDGQVDSLNNMATVHYMQAGYLEALREYRAAMQVIDAAGAQDWTARKRGITVANLAALYQRLGQYQNAIELYRETGKDLSALDLNEQARLLTNEGALYRRLEDPQKALHTYRTALSMLSQDENLDGRISLLKNIGIVQALDLRDARSASATFAEALQLAEKTGNKREAMQARLYLCETGALLGDFAASEARCEAALSAARDLGTTEEQWKALYGLGRALLATGRPDQAAARLREAIAVIESTRAKLALPALRTDFLADKRDVYDALIELSLPSKSPAEIFDLLERSRARTFQDRVATPAPALAAVQARLGPEQALLELWTGPHGNAALWITSGGAQVTRFHLDLARIDELTRALPEEGGAWKPIAAELGDRLLGGIEGLAGARQLIVVPDGPLATVPFEVLMPHGGPMLVERMAVSYQPSAALLLREPPRRSWSFPWKTQLEAFADPRVSQDPSAKPADALGGRELLGPLPASAEEARQIASACRGRAELHLGADDLKQHLEGHLEAPLLHLATHAMADFAVPERSRILFSPANPQDRADYLFLKEVYALDLTGVDLATLSACDTERGKAVRGEGVQGFGRALLSAGARSSITALWRVADGPTRELMKQLYWELNRGVPKAEALRNAKLRLLRSGTELAEPRFWAAFVLNGDGQRAIPRVIRWSWLAVAAALLVLAALAAVRARR